MKFKFFTEHMYKVLGRLYDMANEAIKNGCLAEAHFCFQVFLMIDIPEEVLYDHKANCQGGLVWMYHQTKALILSALEYLKAATPEQIEEIQKSQAEWTQWKYYK